MCVTFEMIHQFRNERLYFYAGHREWGQFSSFLDRPFHSSVRRLIWNDREDIELSTEPFPFIYYKNYWQHISHDIHGYFDQMRVFRISVN